MEDLNVYFNMVEDTIRKYGVDPAITRGENPGQWTLKRGSATVWVDLWHIDKENRAYFQVMAPVMKEPAPNVQLEFYKELTTLNYSLYGCAFVFFKDWIYLKVIRECVGLDPEEVEASITRIGVYGDDYDDYLKNKYGAATAGFSAPGGTPGPTVF